MTLRDALTIIAHRGQFDDLDTALALIGVRLDVHATRVAVPRESAVDPADLTVDESAFSSNLTADGWWGEGDPSGEDSNPGDPSDSDEGRGERASGKRTSAGHPRGGEGKRPGVIASVVRGRPDPSDAAQRAPLQYQSVPRGIDIHSTVSSPAHSVFSDRTLSSTLHGMARVWQEGVEPDTTAIVESIARLEPLGQMPTVPRRGEPGRIAVLCDLGLRSGPYRADARHLLQALRRLFGDQRLQLLTFRGSPSRGCGTGPVWTWAPYAAQPKFDAALVISVGVTTRECDPELVHAFAMDELSAGREVGTVLIGAPGSTPPVRPYPQLLVRD